MSLYLGTRADIAFSDLLGDKKRISRATILFKKRRKTAAYLTFFKWKWKKKTKTLIYLGIRIKKKTDFEETFSVFVSVNNLKIRCSFTFDLGYFH